MANECDHCEKRPAQSVDLTLWDTNEGAQDFHFCSNDCFVRFVTHRWITEA